VYGVALKLVWGGEESTTIKKVIRKTISPEVVSKILRTVSITEAFHFFTDIGQCDGKSATSLADFSENLRTAPLKSIEFHFRRGDFERWIRGTLGDEYLADMISTIDKSADGEALRTAIRRTVDARAHDLSNYISRTRREKRHTHLDGEETETEDIYDDKQREEMLKDDEITAAENAFMQGREMTPEKRKRPTHKDTVSVELAEDEYEED
jgi:hypothetical protein